MLIFYESYLMLYTKHLANSILPGSLLIMNVVQQFSRLCLYELNYRHLQVCPVTFGSKFRVGQRSISRPQLKVHRKWQVAFVSRRGKLDLQQVVILLSRFETLSNRCQHLWHGLMSDRVRQYRHKPMQMSRRWILYTKNQIRKLIQIGVVWKVYLFLRHRLLSKVCLLWMPK